MSTEASLVFLFSFMAGVTIIDNWFEIGIFIKMLFDKRKRLQYTIKRKGEDIMNKKLLILGLASALTLGLAGCSSGYETGEDVDGNFKAIGDMGDFDLLRDKATGCVYIQSHHDSAEMSPYIGRDGKVMGCGDSSFSVSELDGDFE